jgi:hypothetical protein
VTGRERIRFNTEGTELREVRNQKNKDLPQRAQKAQRRWRRPDKAEVAGRRKLKYRGLTTIEIWRRSGAASDAGHDER